MSQPDLARLRQLLDQATPRPWQALDDPLGAHICRAFGGDVIVNEMDGENSEQTRADAALIVEAVNSLPSLLNRLERLENLAEATEAYLETLLVEGRRPINGTLAEALAAVREEPKP